MTDDETATTPADDVDEKDRAITEAFDYLVDDDLEGFAVAASIDGELTAMSYTPADDDPLAYMDRKPCQIPRNILLGKLIADFALYFGQPPEEVADVAAHVAVDHLGVDDEKIGEIREELIGNAERARHDDRGGANDS